MAGGLTVPTVGTSLLTEETIKQATQDFEATMRAIMQQQQQLVFQQGTHHYFNSCVCTETSNSSVHIQIIFYNFFCVRNLYVSPICML